MGRVKLHVQWKVKSALKFYNKAYKINPNNPETLVQLGFCAHIMGDHSRAMDYSKKACDLDPFSLMTAALGLGFEVSIFGSLPEKFSGNW